MKLKNLIVNLSILAIGFFTLWFGWTHRNQLYDWYKLRGYSPPLAVANLANATTLTSSAKHLFYVNKPSIELRTEFNQNCPNNGGEQTIVLGCYHSGESGIFIYSVNDPKLSGVEDVTAAHELLHAEYERLSPKDRNYVNGLLLNYYLHSLHDKRLINTIAAYKKSEPNDIDNEMHSVFGTEASNLPASLEAYYKRYFINRNKIVQYAMQYQEVFTSRQAQAAVLLTQIKTLEAQLNNLQSEINSDQANLTAQFNELQASRPANGSGAADYNSRVDAYNAKVEAYKQLIAEFNQLVKQHNQLVNQYQAITVETNALYQELNSRASTITSQ